MQYLAVDLGDVRTGLAAGDRESRVVSPAGLLEISRTSREGDLVRAVADAAREYGAEVIVLGLPVHMDDGSEGQRAKIVRAFAASLIALCGENGPRVLLHDERLSSFAAEEHLTRSGRTHGQKKRMRDQLAAAAILEDHFRSPASARDPLGEAPQK